MSKFWQKKYISKYTGEEIDAAVSAGSQVPKIDIEDAGKILGVDAEGKIVTKDTPLPENAATGSVMVKTADGWQAVTENDDFLGPYSRLLNSTAYPAANNSYAIPFNKRDGEGNLTINYIQQGYSEIGDSRHSYFLEQRATLLRFTDEPFVQLCYTLNSATITKIITALAADLTTIISNGSGTVTVSFDDTNPDDSDALGKLASLINANNAPNEAYPNSQYNNIGARSLNFMGYPTPIFTIMNNSDYNISSSVSGSCIICVSALYNIKIDFIFILNSDSTLGTLKMYCNVLS